jgi:hypothetical protein
MTDPLRVSVAPRLDETGRETPCVHRSSWFPGSGSERGRGTRWQRSSALPGKPPLDPDFADVEKPLVWADLVAEENLDGLSEEQLAEFRTRAVPVPGALLREGYEFANDARREIPSTIIATGYSAADYQKGAKEHPEWSFLAGIPELHDITWIDLPTSHWPMWSRPAELAAIIGAVATKASAARAAGASR